MWPPLDLSEDGVVGTFTATGCTGSLVHASVVSRVLTATVPLCAIAMESAALLEARWAELFPEWAPSETNIEADRLADVKTWYLTSALHVRASISQTQWKVLDRSMVAGVAFQRDAALHQQRKKNG